MIFLVTHCRHFDKNSYNELHMPAKTPPLSSEHEKALQRLGREIHRRRKALKITATTTSEAAGVSRMTLNRIERGEPSVTLGAYYKVIVALGLAFDLYDSSLEKGKKCRSLNLPEKIKIADYPQLKKISWQHQES